MTAEVVDLAVVRGAFARAVPVEEYVAPMSLDEIEVEVQAIRAELVSPMQRLARLRAAGAHLTAFGPSVTWHDAVERWLGDLRVLRLSGSAEAVAERDALVQSIRATGATTRAIRDRLGVSAYAVQQALAGQRREPVAAPSGRVYEQAAEYLRRAVDGLTLVELARVAGWSEGKASGALSDCVRRKGLAVRSDALRGGMRIHYPCEVRS
jgi:hypothetical protein